MWWKELVTVLVGKARKLVSIISTTITVVSAITTSCAPPPNVNSATPPVGIPYTGRVMDGNNQQLIEGAKVTLDLQGTPRVDFTDTEGIYRFELSISSEMSGTIRVDAQGYEVYTRSILVSPNQGPIEDIRLTPTSTVPTSVTFTSLDTETPSSTPTATATSTFTLTPSFTPSMTATATTNPMVFRGLDQQCLSPSLWEPFYYQGESKEVDSRNCWNLSEWGITPENQGLSIVVNDSDLGQDITRRFYTKIKGDAEIKFTVRIDHFTTKPNFDGVLMMGVGSSSTVLDSGYYLKYAVVENENKFYRDIGPGLKLYYEPRSEYTLGESQNIIIRITGTQAKIIADGIVIHSATLTPDERSVFWIIYSLPSQSGSLIAEISDFQIYDHR